MPGQRLKKELTLRQVFTLIFGNIIGVGWIIVGASWILDGGSIGAMLAFLIGAVALVPVALCYSELAAMYPLSGGEAVYAYEAFGSRVAFVSGWFLAFGFVGIALFETVAIGWLVTLLIPSLTGSVAYVVLGYQVTWGALAISGCGVVLITAINYFGGGTAGRFQDLMTWLLLFFCMVFVVGGISMGNAENLLPLFRGTGASGAFHGFILVLITTPAWYAGFNSMPQAIGEVAELNDARLLAKIVASTVIAGGLFYASVILATSFAAPYAILDGAELGVATAMEFAFKSHWMGKVVLLTGLLGLLTTWNAVFYCATRVLFALGRAKLIHPNLGRTHDRHGSPHLAVLLVGSICILGGLAGRPALLIVINSAALGFSIVYFIACCAMVRIRQLRPDAERPFRMFGYPWLCILAIGYVGLMVVFTLYFSWIERQTLIPMEWTLAAAWIVVGFITWFGSHRVRNRISEEERRELLHTR